MRPQKEKKEEGASHEETAASAIRRAHRFFDGLYGADADTTSDALLTPQWALYQGYNQTREEGATATTLTAVVEETHSTRTNRRPTSHHQKTLKTANRTPSVLESCDWSQRVRHSPRTPITAQYPRQRTPTQPVKCPPRRRIPEEQDPPAVTFLHPPETNQAAASSTHDMVDAAAEEDVEYLKRLYEMRTWDMYVRITEARKQRELQRASATSSSATTGGGVRGVVPMVPVLDHPGTDRDWIESSLAQQQLLDASVGTGDSEHEMIFACDME